MNTTSMENKVLDLIKFDREIRNDKKYEDDMFTLDQLSENCEWDYTLPTLVKDGYAFNKSKINNIYTESFKANFFKKFPELKDITWDNIFIAGGCVGECILKGTNSSNNSNDVDIFIYADTDEKASETVDRLLGQIVNAIKKKRANEINKKNTITQITLESVNERELCIEYKRNKYTLNMGDFQIIFRRYSSKSEIIHGFDMGSAAVGFDGKNVYFTSLSKFAYEYGYNIIDTMRRSTSYEHRLKKYFQRGFDIIMPEFDIEELDTHLYKTYRHPNICEMPFLCFTFFESARNKIIINKFYNKVSDSYISDYGDIRTDDFNEWQAFYTNLYKIIIGKSDEMVYVSGTYNEILNPEVNFMECRIDEFYDSIHKKITTAATFPTSVISKYLPNADIIYIFANRMNERLISDEINKQKSEIKEKLRTVTINKNIQWLSVDPGTQLTSSFNPIIKNAEDWYGVYFKKML